MKFVLPVALLFASATAVQAQTPVPTPPDPTPVVAAPAPAPAPVPVMAPAPAPAPAPAAPTAPAAVGADVDRSAAPPAVTAEAKVMTEAAADEAAIVQDTPRNFWWMVGAIVLAGIILAAVL